MLRTHTVLTLSCLMTLASGAAAQTSALPVNLSTLSNSGMLRGDRDLGLPP